MNKMGVVEFCEVKFLNNPNKVFHSGQALSGVVEIDLKKTLKVRRVYLTLLGQAKCKWLGAGKVTDLEGKPRNRIVKFCGKEAHINSSTNFIDRYEEIPPGKRKWNFTCQLPAELPSSTMEKHGFITYKIVITFERSNNLNLEHTVAINVIRPFNLASDPSLRNPEQELISRTFLTSILETRPLRAKVTIPYRGFAVGQLVDLKVDIENPTFFDVKKVIVTLVKITDHKSQTPYPKIEKSLVKLERISAGQPFCRGNRQYKLYFHIPETVPTITDESCVIMNVSYQIRVKVKLLKYLKSPVAEFPIHIGTIPIVDPKNLAPPSYEEVIQSTSMSSNC